LCSNIVPAGTCRCGHFCCSLERWQHLGRNVVFCAPVYFPPHKKGRSRTSRFHSWNRSPIILSDSLVGIYSENVPECFISFKLIQMIFLFFFPGDEFSRSQRTIDHDRINYYLKVTPTYNELALAPFVLTISISS